MSPPHRFDTVEVMEHISGLLAGHWALLQQFNRFLPAGYRIEPLVPSLRVYKCWLGVGGAARKMLQAHAEPEAAGASSKAKPKATKRARKR